MSKDLLISAHSLPRPAPLAPQERCSGPVTPSLKPARVISLESPDPPRCVDLTHCRITVVAKEHWEAFNRQDKLVEFRSGNQTVALSKGMLLLFSMVASERRRGNTDLVSAEVLTVLLLTCAQACARFPVEAHSCNLPQMCSNWHCDTVNCIVFKKESLHRTKMLVNLAQGNLGILRQFMGTTGLPRFCHIDDLDRILRVRNSTGKSVTCSFHASWPTASDTRRARSVAGENGGGRGRKRPLDSTSTLQDHPRKISTSGATLEMVQHDAETEVQSVPVKQHINEDGNERALRAVSLAERMTSLQILCPLESETIQAFRQLAKCIPFVRNKYINQQVTAMLNLNVGDSLSSNSISRFRLKATSAVDSALVSARDKSAAFVSRIITYVANLVAVSVLLDGAPLVESDSVALVWTKWKNEFQSWVMDTFRKECLRLLPSEVYHHNIWNGGDNPLEEAISTFGLVRDETPAKRVNFLKCDKCFSEDGELCTNLICRGCGAARCIQCFGISSERAAKYWAQQAESYVCEWCLEKHKCGCKEPPDSRQPCTGLLKPDLCGQLCSCCGCDLADPCWSAFPARCRHCYRLFCEKEVATCSLDVSLHLSAASAPKIGPKGLRSKSGATPASPGTLESRRQVALITCIFCAGRKSFLEDREAVFKRMIRPIFPTIQNPVSMGEFEIIPRSELKKAATLKHSKNSLSEIADFVYDMHYAGLREVSRKFLTFLFRMVSAQVQPEQQSFTVLQSSVSPFNLLHFMGQHPLANHKLLENVCLAQAQWSAKEGEALLKKIGPDLEPLQPLKGPGTRKRVGFYAENLFKVGPLIDLVSQSIVLLSKEGPGLYEVFVFGVGTDYDVKSKSCLHPPLKELWEHFAEECRICIKSTQASAENKLRKLRAAKLDVLISLQGWTGSEDVGPILHCRAAPLQINWIEFASIMYAERLVDYTIVGQALGKEQRCSTQRERLAEIESPGTYQPVQSAALLDALLLRPKKDRAFWGLREDRFILFFPGTTNRMDFERYLHHPYWKMLHRITHSIFLFLDKPAGMRGYILASLAEYNASQEDSHKVDASRIIFLNFMYDKCDFLALLQAVGHEGDRGTTVCSFGSVTLATCVGDAMGACVPHHTCRYADGTMQQRVAPEIVTAAGLESLCIGDTPDETVELVVKYAHDRIMQDSLIEHMTQNRVRGIGFWDTKRSPRFLGNAIDRAYENLLDAGGDRTKLKDFRIPFEGVAIKDLRSDTDATAHRYKLLNEAGMPLELLEVTAGVLEALEAQGCTLLKLEGCGAFTIAILAKFSNYPNASVIKMSKSGVYPGQVHNCPLFREAKCIGEWHRALRNKTFSPLLPKPVEVLQDGAFFGHSSPTEDRRVVPFLICEYIPRSFSEVAMRHRVNWQRSMLLEDALRVELLQPMSRALFWLQHNGSITVVVRDLKPDNVRFREDGTMAFVDLGSSVTFQAEGNPSARQQYVSIIERQPTRIDSGAQQPRSGLLQGLSKHGDKIVSIPYSKIDAFCSRAGDRGLAVIGATTPAFRDDKLKQHESVGRLSHNRVLQRFDAKQGCWQDDFAFFRTLLHEMTRQPGEDIATWSNRAGEAAFEGVDGIKRMLLAAGPGCKPQQPQAFQRLADFLHSGLRPFNMYASNPERLSIVRTVTHIFLTTAILTPVQEHQFSSPNGLPFLSGCMHRFWPEGFLNSMAAAVRSKVESSRFPDISYANQPGMGGGVLAKEDISGDAVLGVYVGVRVRNNVCGTVYDAPEHPSRYNVTGQGKIKILTQISPDTKFTCDAQPTLKHDFQWCQLIGNSGPFMNASRSQKSANCIVDRHSAWFDESTGLIWMLVWSKAGGIKKGEYCLWFYNYEAGAGKLCFDDSTLSQATTVCGASG